MAAMKKLSSTDNLYERETHLLRKIFEITGNKDISKEQLLEEYIELAKEYDKLLRTTKKITRFGDVNLKKLMNALELEREKLQLEHIVQERTREIEEKNRQLKEMADLKSRFFTNVSHEFRTPLTLIIGPLEEMLERGAGEERTLTLMLRNAQRLLGLINQLLELSKFESGKMSLKASPQDVVSFVKGNCASFELLSEQNELELTCGSETDRIELYFDPGKLEEVVYNLLLNAIKFTPPGGMVSLNIAENPDKDETFPDGSVDISVTDTGIGIPPNRLEHIFDRFYQVESSYETGHKGSGIGLAIIKELVELHHGEITVTSPASYNSGGTKFVVRLPLGTAHLEPGEIIPQSENPFIIKTHAEIRELYMAEKEEKERLYASRETDDAAAGITGPAAGTGGKPVILVVEDSPGVRDYIKGALHPLYNVMEAVNGKAGLEKAKEHGPDLVISDVMMPEMDGFELCRTLKQNIDTSHVPIILLTAKSTEQDILEGLETGADDYVIKPFNTKILLARIKNLIELRRQFQQSFKRELTLQPTEMPVSPIDKEFIKDLQKVIRENMDDPDLNVDGLSKKLYVGRTTLYRKIHAFTGESPTDFIRSYRLKRGAELLKESSATVLEVALEVGFSSASYFARCFKEKFHQSPSDFQKGG
jgi:signal transduction histidine kinase/DNA-binding response OmpR family regulator